MWNWSVVKVVLWSRGAHLTKPGWSKSHTHSNPTNLALFGHKITLYRFNQRGLILLQGAQMGAGGAEPPCTPHFNHWNECSGLVVEIASSIRNVSWLIWGLFKIGPYKWTHYYYRQPWQVGNLLRAHPSRTPALNRTGHGYITWFSRW